MLAKFSKKTWPWLIILPVWTYAAFMLAQLVFRGVIFALDSLGVPLTSINQTLFITIGTAIIYSLAALIAVGVPRLLWKRVTSRKDLGVPDLPAWMDILLTVPAYIVYIICSGILVLISTKIFSGIDLEQAQSLPFSRSMLGAQWQYFLAFITLVVFAPLAEELLFRGYLYGKLRKTAPVWAAVIITSLTFGAAHLWGGPDSPLQWAVAIDTLALSIVLCLLREHTGAIWAGVLVHALKNGIAFYLLFVNPQVIDQLKEAAVLIGAFLGGN